MKSKKIDRSHIAEHVAAKDRARANPQVLHESGGKLGCFVTIHSVTDKQTDRRHLMVIAELAIATFR